MNPRMSASVLGETPLDVCAYHSRLPYRRSYGDRGSGSKAFTKARAVHEAAPRPTVIHLEFHAVGNGRNGDGANLVFRPIVAILHQVSVVHQEVRNGARRMIGQFFQLAERPFEAPIENLECLFYAKDSRCSVSRGVSAAIRSRQVSNLIHGKPIDLGIEPDCAPSTVVAVETPPNEVVVDRFVERLWAQGDGAEHIGVKTPSVRNGRQPRILPRDSVKETLNPQDLPLKRIVRGLDVVHPEASCVQNGERRIERRVVHRPRLRFAMILKAVAKQSPEERFFQKTVGPIRSTFGQLPFRGVNQIEDSAHRSDAGRGSHPTCVARRSGPATPVAGARRHLRFWASARSWRAPSAVSPSGTSSR